jgi:hypothetical protein
MGEFEKGRNEDKFGQSEKSDKSAFQQLGDDKGEGGQQDIRTDSVETSQAKPELAGAEGGGEDFGKQQGGQDFGQGKQQQGGQGFGQEKQQQGEKFGEEKRPDESGKLGEDDKQSRF